MCRDCMDISEQRFCVLSSIFQSFLIYLVCCNFNVYQSLTVLIYSPMCKCNGYHDTFYFYYQLTTQFLFNTNIQT